MPADNRIQALATARQAVAERQLEALRRWLGDDHELIRLHRAQFDARQRDRGPRGQGATADRAAHGAEREAS